MPDSEHRSGTQTSSGQCRHRYEWGRERSGKGLRLQYFLELFIPALNFPWAFCVCVFALCIFFFFVVSVLNRIFIGMNCAWNSLHMGESTRKLLWAFQIIMFEGQEQSCAWSRPWLNVFKDFWAKVWGPAVGSSGNCSLGLGPSYWGRGIVLRASRNWIQTLVKCLLGNGRKSITHSRN